MKAIPLKKKKQTKGKGGAWRALVRMETQGVSQPSNLKQVAVAYRKIKQEDGQRYRELLRLGRLATMSGKKCSDAKRTSFGLRYKQFVHAKKHLHIQHLAAQIQGLTADGRARHMLQYVRDQDATPDEAMKLCKAIERHWGKMKIQKECSRKPWWRSLEKTMRSSRRSSSNVCQMLTQLTLLPFLHPSLCAFRQSWRALCNQQFRHVLGHVITSPVSSVWLYRQSGSNGTSDLP